MSQLNVSNDELAELFASAIEIHNPEWTATTHLQTAVMLAPLYTQNQITVEPPFGSQGYALKVSFLWKLDPIELVATNDPNWFYNWQIKTQLQLLPNVMMDTNDGLETYNQIHQALVEINPVAWWPIDVAAMRMEEQNLEPVFVGHSTQAVIETREQSILAKIIFNLDAKIEIPLPDDDNDLFSPILPQLAQFFGLLERFIVDLSEATHSIGI